MQLGGISSVLKNIQDFICIIIVFLPIILDRALLSHLLRFYQSPYWSFWQGAIGKKKHTFKKYFWCFLVQFSVSRNSSIFSCQSHWAEASKTPPATSHLPLLAPPPAPGNSVPAAPGSLWSEPEILSLPSAKAKDLPPTPHFFLPPLPVPPSLRKTWFHGTPSFLAKQSISPLKRKVCAEF